MRRRWRIGAAAALAIGLAAYLFARRDAAPTTARTQSAAADPTAQDLSSPPTPALDQVRAPLPARPAPAPAPGVDTAASERMPSGLEQIGYLRDVYDRWSVGSEDPGATRRAAEYLAGQWDDLGVRPKSQSVLCTPEVCRLRVAFNDLSSVYNMTQMKKGDDVEAVSGAPEPAADGSYSIILYWAQPGSTLRDVPPEVVRR